MNPYLKLSDTTLRSGHIALLDKVDFQLNAGERIALVGGSGDGKSCMLKMLAGQLAPDAGSAWRAPGISLCYVPENPVLDANATVFDEIVRKLESLHPLICDYRKLTRQLAEPDADFDELIEAMHPLQLALQAGEGWAALERIETAIEFLDLNVDSRIADISEGARKRTALAQALVALPAILILDDPTRHLDLPAIKWLEELLKNYGSSVLLISHDRHFIDHVVTRIVELHRGKLGNFPGNLSTYLQLKEQELKSIAFRDANPEEELWRHQRIKVRHSRMAGRVLRLEKLRLAREARRENPTATDARSGKTIVELSRIVKKFGTRKIIDNFSCQIRQGDKIGLFGNKGPAQNALLKIIFNKVSPDSGSVKLDKTLKVIYADDLRANLNEESTVLDTVTRDGGEIEFVGAKTNVAAYLGYFLFSPERSRVKIKDLSGGERSRLLLALLFARPSDVLVLNDPTPGLDVETLELLDELLARYAGTVFLISNDRAFLDNVATQMIVFEGDGKLTEFPGGHDDWLQSKKKPESPQVALPLELQNMPPSRVAEKHIDEQREYVRHLCRWRIAIIYENAGKNDIFHGRTADLSSHGATVFVHHNIFRSESVTMLLAVPPLNAGQRETIIEIRCRMTETILDSEHSLFRIGLYFESFKGNGINILNNILNNRSAQFVTA
jgi:ATP-binding cassette subfamily F protein uup